MFFEGFLNIFTARRFWTGCLFFLVRELLKSNVLIYTPSFTRARSCVFLQNAPSFRKNRLTFVSSILIVPGSRGLRLLAAVVGGDVQTVQGPRVAERQHFTLVRHIRKGPVQRVRH